MSKPVNDGTHKQTIVVRKDLNMPVGKLAAQVAHASVGCTIQNLEDPRVQAWLAGRFTKIVVAAESEQHLLDIQQKCNKNGVLSTLITDAGFTIFDGQPTITCLAVGPDTNEVMKTITGDLPLYK